MPLMHAQGSHSVRSAVLAGAGAAATCLVLVKNVGNRMLHNISADVSDPQKRGQSGTNTCSNVTNLAPGDEFNCTFTQ